ncbi:MAG: aminodeoxychorismate/anthranilate synthase component II [Saprospiraceae bacterium]|nr:aminodeoxychorismate/anthranilate synthase component II [Saprospiraceae bacterium]
MRILLIDNYDSFTYNLVQYIREISVHPVTVVRNDAITLEQVAEYDTIIISPGPGIPSDSGITCDVIRQYHKTKSIFGVCLGMQAIGEVFGGQLHNLSEVHHGVDSDILQRGDDPLFSVLPQTFRAGRYHSWVVLREDLPEDLEVIAEDQNGTIMALKHKKYNVRGVQFHPESILTPQGKQILKNFLQLASDYYIAIHLN